MSKEFDVRVETDPRLRAFEIKRAGHPVKLIALVVKDGSLFIPLIANKNAYTAGDNRALAAKTNYAACLGLDKKSLFSGVANKVLKMPYYGHVNGVYCDGQAIDGLNGLHLFSEEKNDPEELLQRIFSSQRMIMYEEIEY